MKKDIRDYAIGDEKVVASAATAPPSTPVGFGELIDTFNLVRACESAVRRLGRRSSDNCGASTGYTDQDFRAKQHARAGVEAAILSLADALRDHEQEVGNG